MSTQPLVVLTAGGTGGHVFPADALAEALLLRGYRLALVTDARGKAYGGTLGTLDTYGVSAAQMLGRGILGKLRGAASLGLGLLQARALLRRLRPAAVVGFGGYASVPAIGAATMLGIPTLIHEQNAVLGRANRLFAPRVTRIATAFQHVSHMPKGKDAVRVGMPVRESIALLAGEDYAAPGPTDDITILVLGGSQGARAFSDVLPDAFKALPDALRARLHIVQQCRPEDLERVDAAYEGTGMHVTLRSFFDDVPQRLKACHLLIARSGASTVAEATVAGRPALLVPYPHAADDHQTANARAVEGAGAAWVMPQTEMTAESVAARLQELLAEPGHLEAAAAAARDWSIPDAADRLAAAVDALISGEKK